MPRHMNDPKPKEIAAGVYCFSVGRGIRQVNVYLVQSGSSWALIDAGWGNQGQLIRMAAELLFGTDRPPTAILLTHIHPDHSGSARELERIWGLSIYVHPDEMPLALGGLIPEYFSPLDRWFIAPLMKLVPRRMREARLAEESLAGVARAIDTDASVPGLPDWRCIPTPGHTPGHIAFFRSSDGVLISGDAVLTVNINSPWDWLLKRHRVSGPPYIATWNWRMAKQSVAVLAALQPRVLACGHGKVMTEAETARKLRSFSERLSTGKKELSHQSA